MNLKLLHEIARYANELSNADTDDFEGEDGCERHGYLHGVRDAMFLAVDLIKGEDAEGGTDANDMIDRILSGWNSKQLGD